MNSYSVNKDEHELLTNGYNTRIHEHPQLLMEPESCQEDVEVPFGMTHNLLVLTALQSYIFKTYFLNAFFG